MLRILNSQSRTKEEFKPLDPAGLRVGMYTCGPTVYGSLHLGNARTLVAMDVVRRYLEYKGFQVRYVTNLTDVEDKIIKRALKDGRPWREITAQYTEEYHRVMAALNVKPSDVNPRATDHIPEMLEIVARLLAKKHAYVAADGDVYFNTASFSLYGKLSSRNLEEEEAGLSGRIAPARQAVKKNRGDFVLWKLNRNDRDELAKGGDAVPRWPSPWGDGRPGWHLECSAMSQKYLGVPFDLHGGGQDLLFPHHEDEKAQTECAFHDTLGKRESVRYWVHSAFLNLKATPEDAQRAPEHVDRESGSVKMSKSLGNVWWVKELLWPEGPYDPAAVRMLLLSAHYRSPIVFEPALLEEATAKLERIYNALESIARALQETPQPPAQPAADAQSLQAIQNFETAMDDDFNSAGALAAIFDLVVHANQALANKTALPDQLRAWATALKQMLEVLGLRAVRAKAAGSAADSDKLVELLIQARQEARAAKQYALGDKIRDGLKALGYEIEDLPGGKWVVKKR